LNGGAIGRGQGFNIDYVVTDLAIVASMKLYGVDVTLYGFDAMINDDGPMSIFSQVELKFKAASADLARYIAIDLYGSTQDPGRGNSIEGFKAWYDDGNLYPSVGGQTRVDLNPIGAVGGLNAYTNTINNFTLSAVNRGIVQAWNGPDHVDLIAATRNGFELIMEALQPNMRYAPQDSDIAKIGFQTLRFITADVAVDGYAPTGTGNAVQSSGVMYGLNTKYIEWYFSTNPKFQFGFTGFKEAIQGIDYAGQFLVGNTFMVANPRSGFKLLSTAF
jgi:hypothetical protein